MDQNEIDVIVNLITDQFTSAAKTIGIAVQQMGTDVADSAQKQQTSLDKISTIGASWQFRYLANIAREAFDQMVSDIENVIGVAANLQQTF